MTGEKGYPMREQSIHENAKKVMSKVFEKRQQNKEGFLSY